MQRFFAAFFYRCLRVDIIYATLPALLFENRLKTTIQNCRIAVIGGKQMLEIRAIFFDFGKTLIDYNLELIFRSFAHLSGVPPEDVHEIWASRGAAIGLSDSFERGLMQPAEFRRRWKEGLIARLPADKEYKHKTIFRFSDKKFDECWNDMFGPRDLLYEEYLKRLRDAGYYLGIISNINPLHYAFISERYKELISLFSHFTASCDFEVQARKPDAKIFRVAFAKAKIDPKHIVYIDDVAENAHAVFPFGAHGIVVKTFSQIFADLKAMGVRW